MKNLILPAILLTLFLISCHQKPGNREPGTMEPGTLEPGTLEPGTLEPGIKIPLFNADSALSFVKAQCDFGPRVPGTDAHRECGDYLAAQMRLFSPDVTEQAFKARAYDGAILSGRNIITRFQPEQKARIMLAAHWDSRPFADHDPDPAKRAMPVMGANDGASGVGVLIEIARLLAEYKPAIGVDIFFFDLEDYGPPEDAQGVSKNEYWGLGSQHWSRNPHEYNYRPRYCILLDMVGAPDAVFMQEGFSIYYAPDKVKKVWDTAHRLGYGKYFPYERGSFINDDHYFINEIARIPAIDIIHLDPNSSNGSFFEYWHTTEDTFERIDKETLRVVGEVATAVLFGEK
jgi:hypothetical protein